MIWIDRRAGSIGMRQEARPPVVYLDQWALMDLAEGAAGRLSNALARRGGTLAISGVHILECAKVGSVGTRESVERLLDAVCPNLCFLEAKAGTVIGREDLRSRGQLEGGAQFDNEFLDVFVLRGRAGREYSGLSAEGLLAAFLTPEGIEIANRGRERIAESFQDELDQWRTRYTTDARVRRSAHEVPKGPPQPAPTRHLYLELMHSLVRDRIRMTPNDWFDFAHAVVPVAYCDIVLLDRRWAALATAACRRLREARILRRSARVFAPHQLVEFWAALEA